MTNRSAKTSNRAPRPADPFVAAISMETDATGALLETGQNMAQEVLNIRRQSAESVQHGVEASLEMAAELAERSMHQLANAAGAPAAKT